MGFDFTFYGIHFLSIGAGLIVIDPLALTVVDDDGKTTRADWATLLTPGGYLRIGIFDSPVALLGYVSYQPGLKSATDCGGQPCWTGAFQIGGSLAVDIPILVLR